MNRTHLVSSCAVALGALLFACGDGGGGATSGSGSAAKPAGSTPASAKPADSAKPATTGSAATTSSASETASSMPSGSAPPAASGGPAAGAAFPADVQKLIDGLKEPAELKDPKLEGFFFKAPKGAKINAAPAPGSWNELVADGASMAFLAHSQSDGGDGCPKVADMKKKVQGAKDIVAANGKLKPWGKESPGESFDLWVFEKDGKAGFYGAKVFDKKDDDVTYCCAGGKPGEAEQMKGLMDKAKAEMLAGICMSIVEKQ